MSPESIGLIGIGALLVLLAARMWIGAAMAVVGFIGIVLIRGFGEAGLMSETMVFQKIAFYPMSVIPLFVLMGMVIAETRIGTDLYDTAYKCVGQLRGGLAIATTIACAFLAAVTGISSPALVTMGKIALPEMRRYKYNDELATGCIACAGTLAFLIPPSIALILYGILTEQSVGKLYMAGIFPGILLAALFVVTIMVTTALRPQAGPSGPKTRFKEKIVSLKSIWHVVLLFLLVLGGIYGGVFTPTEAGAIGAVGAIVIGVALRQLTLKSFIGAIKETVLMTGMILLIIGGAFIFMHFMSVSRVPLWLGDFVAGLNMPPMAVWAGIVFLYIILGMFLDIFAATTLTIPIIYPVILALGFDPIWFGVMLVILIEFGLVTPPVGMDVYILGGITGTPVSTIFRGVWPFCVAVIICIIILTIFPQIALFIPNMM